MTSISDTRIYTPEGPLTEICLTRVPAIPKLFATLIALSLVRKSHLNEEDSLGRVRTVYEGWQLDPEKVSRFKSICGYGNDGPEVPAPYIQTLFIGLVSRFISSSHFPINPMGLIQIGQSFSIERPIAMSESLDLSCTLRDMTQTPRGITTRFEFEAESSGRRVWQGIATYFTRAKNPPPKEKSRNQEEEGLPVREVIRVAADTGRRYAAVSRDYNPHHLYPWTAKLIGFKRAIAHGIWSLARAGASLEKACGYPEGFEMEGALKLPIFLPAAITLGYKKNGEDILFELRDEKKSLPHLKGTFRF